MDWGLPDLMDMLIEPTALVATLPKLSWTCTDRFGIGLPAVPGPGVAGMNTSLDAEPGDTVKFADTPVITPSAAVSVVV